MTIVVTALLSLLGSLAATAAAERLQHPVRVLGSSARLTLSHNPGIAFGIRLPASVQEVVIGLALLAVMFLARREAKDLWSRIGFGLIIGGGVANLIDRFGDGVVTDYIAIGSFPVFNAADSCITIGAAALLFIGIRRKFVD